MTDPKPEKRGRGWAFYTLIVLLSLAVLYPLSMGPAEWAVRHDRMSTGVFTAVYRPVWWLANHHEPFGRIIRRYARLWTPIWVEVNPSGQTGLNCHV